jgi:hypothetical protein
VSFLRKCGLIAILWNAACAVAAAVDPPPPADWSSVERLQSDSKIRVTVAGGRRFTGLLKSVTAETLALQAATGQEPWRREQVRRVQRPVPGHRARNTLIGMSVGLAIGSAYGAYLDRGGRVWLFERNSGKMVFIPGMGISGTAIGVALPTGGWRDVYRVP